MSSKPLYVAIELGSDFVRWGTCFAGRQMIRSIPLSNAVQFHISARNSAAALIKEVLMYIRDHERHGLPDIVSVSFPYLTIRDLAQIESVIQCMGISRLRIMKRISSFAVSVNNMGLSCEKDEHVLLIDSTESACETAIAQMGFGIVEMCSVVQRQVTPDTPMNVDFLRKDIFKAIDSSGAKKIVGIYVSNSLPSEYRKMLKDSFHLESIRMSPHSVLTGSMIQGEVIAGRMTNVLLLDATDYEICVGQDVLLDAGITVPVKRTIEIPYRPARPDKCIDIFIKKNNMLLDTPQCIKLLIQPLLLPKQKENKLRVTADIDREGRLSVKVESVQTGKKISYAWNEIRDRLIP